MALEPNELTEDVLSALYDDSQRDPSTIADEIGAEASRVEEEMDRLVNEDIITQFTAVPDPAKIGFPIPSYHFIGLADNYDEAVRSGLPYFQAFGGSELALVVLGEYDLVFRKLSESDARLNNFMNNIINDPDYPSHESSETYRVTERIRWRGFNISEEDRYETEPVQLTGTEEATLEILREDGRLRARPDKIAERVGSSPEAVLDAIDRLENEVILGYSVDIDFEKLGWHRAFLGLSSLQGEYGRVIQSLQESDPLHVPFVLSGAGFNWAHIGVELVFKSIDELDNLTDEIRNLGGARETRTFLSTKTLLDERATNSS